MENMSSLRCPECNRLLCGYRCTCDLEVQIKCNRCKKLVRYIQKIEIVADVTTEE